MRTKTPHLAVHRVSLKTLIVFVLFCAAFSVDNPFMWIVISYDSRLGDFFTSFEISRDLSRAFCVSLQFFMLSPQARFNACA